VSHEPARGFWGAKPPGSKEAGHSLAVAGALSPGLSPFTTAPGGRDAGSAPDEAGAPRDDQRPFGRRSPGALG
jgi:hypothetical protein